MTTQKDLLTVIHGNICDIEKITEDLKLYLESLVELLDELEVAIKIEGL